MKINELSNELSITNKELITFLKENKYKVSSHMQTASDEMIDLAREYFVSKPTETIEETVEVEKVKPVAVKKSEAYVPKTFNPEDKITCRSVTPWELVTVGLDRNTVYSWSGYGDIDYVAYKDLQYMRKKDILKKSKIIIEDADLCYQWSRDLGETYKYFLDVEYPEEFFDLSDEKFRDLLTKAPDVVKEVIKYTALNMVRNENYPTVQKLNIVDEILGTCIKDFL